MTLRRTSAVLLASGFLMMGWICSMIACLRQAPFRTGRTTSEGLPYQWPSSRWTMSEFGAIMAFHSLLMLAMDLCANRTVNRVHGMKVP